MVTDLLRAAERLDTVEELPEALTIGAERGREAGPGLELRRRAEVHGRRGVQEEVEAQVLLVHKELDVEPVEAPVDVPVDVPEVVADPVGAVVAELDAVPAARASPLTPHAPAERAAREQRQALQLRQELRREGRGARGGHRSIAHRAPGSSS